MDVLITPEARREIEGLRIARPDPATWGILIGHKRGFRFIVEKIFPAGSGRTLPGARLVADLDGAWPGRIIGFFAIRPGAAFRTAVLGPLFYGKLFVHLDISAGRPVVRPAVVEFKRRFFLEPVSLAPAGKAETHG
jgi:hypothetical protein